MYALGSSGAVRDRLAQLLGHLLVVPLVEALGGSLPDQPQLPLAVLARRASACIRSNSRISFCPSPVRPVEAAPLRANIVPHGSAGSRVDGTLCCLGGFGVLAPLQLKLPDARVRLDVAPGSTSRATRNSASASSGAIALQVDLAKFSWASALFGLTSTRVCNASEACRSPLQRGGWCRWSRRDGPTPTSGIERSAARSNARAASRFLAISDTGGRGCSGPGRSPGREAIVVLQRALRFRVASGGAVDVREGNPRAFVARIQPYGGPERLQAVVALVGLSQRDRRGVGAPRRDPAPRTRRPADARSPSGTFPARRAALPRASGSRRRRRRSAGRARIACRKRSTAAV